MSNYTLMKLRLGNMLARIRAGICGRHVTAVLTDTENGFFLAPIEDLTVGKKLAFEGAYEVELVRNIVSSLQNEKTVLFVGANLGTLAIPIAKHAERVCAIEASPSIFKYLVWNVYINDASNIETYNFAAGDRTGEVEFIQSRHNTGGSKILTNASLLRNRNYIYDNPDLIKVPMKSLDLEFPDTTFETIVMDIEGAEYMALGGMPNLLSRCSNLFIEMVPHHLKNVANVTNEQFLSRIQGGRFDEVLVVGQNDRAYSSGEALSLLERIDTKVMDGGVDLWFRRRP